MIDNSQRLERKWVFKNINKETLIQNLISHKLFFRFHHKQRYVNSIYFDNIYLKSAEDNLAGISDRKKIRLRWYGPNVNQIKSPILEKKIKKNFQGFKELFTIKELKNLLLNEANLRLITNEVNNKFHSTNLIPVTLVCYKRSYFISHDNKVRATLDIDLKYKKLKNFIQNFYVRSNDIVLELKYSTNLDSYLRNTIGGITRISKNSKYINSLEKNNFFI